MSERDNWLRLAALNETARRKNRLLEQFDSPAALFGAGAAGWREAGIDEGHAARLAEAARADVSAEAARLDGLGVELVSRDDPRYPPLLAEIDDPPPSFFLRGRLPEPHRTCVALVGTRNTSPYGELVAEQIAAALATAGIGIVSGAARGIDSAAQEAALRVGGYTLGVLGCGLDVVFPRNSKRLYERLAEDGGLLSEFRLGTEPLAHHFPIRNRIISGLCRAVVVVQAPSKSGALITAQLALEQGREVLAVPGNITDARQDGCHELIREGATLCRGADDVLTALNLEVREAEERRPAPAQLPELSAAESTVVKAIGLEPLTIDDLIEATGFATPEVQSALITLELKQVVRRLPGNRFVRAT